MSDGLPRSWREAKSAAAGVVVPCAAALLFAGTLADYVTRRPPIAAVSIPKAPISLAGDETRGDPKARVAILEFSDFQCPSCGQFARDVLPSLEDTYVNPGAVLIAFRNMPMSRIHPLASAAAIAATCAGANGAFWAMHDYLFSNPRHLNSSALRAELGDLGVRPDDVDRCLGRSASVKVSRDLDSASSLGVTGTPTFFVGSLSNGSLRVTTRLTGFQTALALANVLKPILGAEMSAHTEQPGGSK
jgi:protein-disulfide isomerase